MDRNMITAYIQAHNAIIRCQPEFRDRWADYTNELLDMLPRGSGFDSGGTIEIINDEHVIVDAPFHKMNGHGYYDGWERYRFHVYPTFGDIRMVRVRGRDCNGLADYVEEMIYKALTAPAPSFVG